MKVKHIIQREIEVPGLSQKIKEARVNRGYKVTAVAQKAGISRKYWYQIENDEIDGCLRFETLKKIESALGVDFGVVFEYSG